MRWFEWLMAAILVIIAAVALASDISGGIFPWYMMLLSFTTKLCIIACIFLTAKACILNFPLAILRNLTFAAFGIIAEMHAGELTGQFIVLPLFIFVPIEIISWVLWAKNKDEQEKWRAKVRSLTPIKNAVTAIIILGIPCIIAYMFDSFSWYRGFYLAVIIASPVLLMLRYREHYIWSFIPLLVPFFSVEAISSVAPLELIDQVITLIVMALGFANWVKLSKSNG